MHNSYPNPQVFNNEAWQQPHDVRGLVRDVMAEEPGVREWVSALSEPDLRKGKLDRDNTPVTQVSWLKIKDSSIDQYTVAVITGTPGAPDCLYHGATLTMDGDRVLAVEGSYATNTNGKPVREVSPLMEGESTADNGNPLSGNIVDATLDRPTAPEELAFAYRTLYRIAQNADSTTGAGYLMIANRPL